MDELRIKLLDQGADSDNTVTCGFQEASESSFCCNKAKRQLKEKDEPSLIPGRHHGPGVRFT